MGGESSGKSSLTARRRPRALITTARGYDAALTRMLRLVSDSPHLPFWAMPAAFVHALGPRQTQLSSRHDGQPAASVPMTQHMRHSSRTPVEECPEWLKTVRRLREQPLAE